MTSSTAWLGAAEGLWSKVEGLRSDESGQSGWNTQGSDIARSSRGVIQWHLRALAMGEYGTVAAAPLAAVGRPAAGRGLAATDGCHRMG